MWPAEVLAQVIDRWVRDPDSDVVYAEQVEGRWATRLRQTVREFTTVWWDMGHRSLCYSAYLLPLLEPVVSEMCRLALVYNQKATRVWLSVDPREEALLLTGWLDRWQVTSSELELILGDLYQSVEYLHPRLVGLMSHTSTQPLGGLVGLNSRLPAN